jgi:3-oxoacyl-[acyl-carrier-protein] synthase-1
MSTLFVDACGAVTPVGLSSLETCASIRAGVNRIADSIPLPPPDEPLKGARIKARRTLQSNPRQWLLNLAGKALGECVSGNPARPIALFVCRPEPGRWHPGMAGVKNEEVLDALQSKAKVMLDPHSRVIETGAAGLVEALKLARDLLRRRAVEQCVVGGFDSLVNPSDVDRLRRFNRIHSPTNPQGVIPGEGAVFLALSTSGRGSPFVPLAAIRGFGADSEPNPVGGQKYPLGEGMNRAVVKALADATVPEREVDFVVSTHNGERYSGWEMMLSHARTYRTRRQGIPVTFPAAGTGDIGVASSALALLVAAVSLARGYAAGTKAVCEFASEGGLRGACLVEAAPFSPAFVAPGRRRAR